MQSIQAIASNLSSAFNDLAQMQQRQTTKVVGEEKKKRDAALSAEKDKKLAAATTAEDRQKIEEQYAAKKEALDAEMDAKAREANRAAFARQKAFNIVQATISTYASAALALGPPPYGAGPILGPILAAVTIAAGLAQVASIASQEVPGLANGAVVTRPTLALIGEAGTEIVAPEQSLIEGIRTELVPRLVSVLAPQIKASVLAAIAIPAGGSGGVVQQFAIAINIENYYGDEEYFDRVLKPKVQDAMRRAGVDSANLLFRNPKR
jgi:hypothetical protein